MHDFVSLHNDLIECTWQNVLLYRRYFFSVVCLFVRLTGFLAVTMAVCVVVVVGQSVLRVTGALAA